MSGNINRRQEVNGAPPLHREIRSGRRTHTHTHTCTHTDTRTHMHTHAHTPHADTRTQTQTHTHRRTHAHTCTDRQVWHATTTHSRPRIIVITIGFISQRRSFNSAENHSEISSYFIYIYCIYTVYILYIHTHTPTAASDRKQSVSL